MLGVALFLGTLVLGTVGFRRQNAELGWLDSFYRALQTFTLNFDLETHGRINAVLQIARFLASLFVVGAVVWLLLRSALEWSESARQAWFRSRSRYVLLGFGAVNGALARELRLRHPAAAVTAVDLTFSEADQQLAADYDILLVAGDLTDPQTFERARVDRSAQVLVACGDDVTAIEVATAAAENVKKLSGGAVVRVHVSDLRLLFDLGEARDLAYARGAVFSPFSLKVDAARDFFDRAQLTRSASDQGRARVHLVIAGMGNQGEAILIETLMNGFADGLAPPKVTIVDRDVAHARARLQALYPRLFDDTLKTVAVEAGVAIDWLDLDLRRTPFDTCPALDALEAGPHPPTAWVLCCGDDKINLTAGLRLELAMQQRDRLAVPIYVRLWGAGIAPDRQDRRLFSLTRTFGDIHHTARHCAVLDPHSDKLPKLLHEFYQREGNKAKARMAKGPAGAGPVQVPLASKAGGLASPAYDMNWAALPENVRESNRRVARHVPVKLVDLGYDWRGAQEGVLPSFDKSLAGELEEAAERIDFAHGAPPPAAGSLEDSILRAARVEHCRWMVDRAISGWRQGPPTNVENGRQNYLRVNSRRWHVNMRPYEGIDADTRRYDTVMLWATLAYLGAPCDQARPRAFRQNAFAFALNGENHLPSAADLEGRTELRVTIGDASAEFTRWAEFANVLAGWSNRAAATRLVLLLTTPVQVPPSRAAADAEGRLAKHLSDACARLPPEIACDVVRRFGKT